MLQPIASRETLRENRKRDFFCKIIETYKHYISLGIIQMQLQINLEDFSIRLAKLAEGNNAKRL